MLALVAHPTRAQSWGPPTLTFLCLQLLVRFHWSGSVGAMQLLFPAQVGESQLGSTPGLALSPGSRTRLKALRTPTSNPGVFLCLRQTTDLRTTALPSPHQPESSSRQRSCSPLQHPSLVGLLSLRTLHRTSQPQGGSWGSQMEAAAPCRSLAWTHPIARAGGYVGFSSDISSGPSLSQERGEQGPVLRGRR